MELDFGIKHIFINCKIVQIQKSKKKYPQGHFK